MSGNLSRRTVLLAGGAALAATGLARPALADTDAERLVEQARITLDAMVHDSSMEEMLDFIRRARGILIFPQIVKGGFIIGGKGGTGVMLARGGDGSWSPPVFMTLAAASIGLQIGGQVSEMILTVMNDGAVVSILKDNFKLGADASIAVGPLGKGIEAATTTNFSADIYAFSRNVGLFGGGALEGAAVLNRESLDESYYGWGVTPEAVVIERKFFNPQSDPLRKLLASV